MKKYRIELQLDGLPKTPNAIGRKHWSVKAQEARKWRGDIVWHVGRNKPAKPLVHARITYTRVSSSPVDADNLAASFKHVQDGLIDAGVLANDRWENIGFPTYLWQRGPKGDGKIKVVVEEVSGSELHGTELTEDGTSKAEGCTPRNGCGLGRGVKAKRVSCARRVRERRPQASEARA